MQQSIVLRLENLGIRRETLLEFVMAGKACERLSRFLELYDGGFLDYSALKKLMIALSIVSFFYLVLIISLKMWSRATRCVAFGHLIASAIFLSLYITLFIHIDRFAPNRIVPNKVELQKIVSECKKNDLSIGQHFDTSKRYSFASNNDTWIDYIPILTLSVSMVLGVCDAFRFCESKKRSQEHTLTPMRATQQQVSSLSCSDVCCICLDVLRLGTLSIPACGHFFHETCLSKWMYTRKNPSCPLCNASIEPISNQNNEDYRE